MSGIVWVFSDFKLPLRECPFCGKKPNLYEGIDPKTGEKLFRVKCANLIFCDVMPSTHFCGNPVLAAEIWNRRKHHGKSV